MLMDVFSSLVEVHVSISIALYSNIYIFIPRFRVDIGVFVLLCIYTP